MKHLRFYGLAAAVLLLDRITKMWAVGALSGGRVVPVIPDTVVLSLVHNRGSAFGLFQNSALGLAILAAVAIGLMVWVERKGLPGRAVRIAVALQLGGALGNFIDRVRFRYVIDFIELDWNGRNIWPVFNVADAAITVGTLILVLWLVRGEIPPAPNGAANGDATSDETPTNL